MLAKLAIASASLFLLSAANAIAAESESLSLGSASLTPPVPLLRSLIVAGRVDAAREQAQSLVEANPGDARSLALLGDILFRQSRFADAEQSYRRAMQADPRCGRGRWGLGRVAMLRSQKTVARDHFAAAFQLDPHDPDIILAYADIVQEPGARAILLRNYLALAAGNEDRARLEDAAARLAITERLGRRPVGKLASPYQHYHLKLAGYFPDRRTQTGLLIQVALNGGKPLRLILDSGADGIFVNREGARRAGLERLAAARIDGIGTAREANTYVGLARHVAIGNLELEDCLVRVMETNSIPDADGVIGMNVFESFLLRVNPALRTLDLVPFADGPDSGSNPADMTRTYRVGHLLLVHASLAHEPVNGDGDRYFMLDTGASFSVTSGPSYWEIPGGAAIEVRGAEGRMEEALRARPMRLNIEGRELLEEKPVKLDLTELSRHEGVEISGIIGYPLLGKFALTINYRDGLVQFGPPETLRRVPTQGHPGWASSSAR